MLTSWRDWRLPHVRRIWFAAYIVVGMLALALGAGAATALVSALVAFAFVGVLELAYRRRHPPGVTDATSGANAAT